MREDEASFNKCFLIARCSSTSIDVGERLPVLSYHVIPSLEQG